MRPAARFIENSAADNRIYKQDWKNHLSLGGDTELCATGGAVHVVLDEADKMLGLGLRPQLDRLREALLPEQPVVNGERTKGENPRRRPQVCGLPFKPSRARFLCCK